MDISKIRQSLNALENPSSGGGGQRNDLVKLPKGDHVVRFVPYKFNKDMPFQELHFHYGVNRQTFLCPRNMNGDPCPICEFASTLWNKFKETEDESFKTAFKDMMPKHRIYAPIVVKKSQDPDLVDLTKVKFWGISPKTYEEIIQEVLAADSEGIDVTSVEEGLDFTVKMDVFGGRNDRFMVKSIKSARAQTPLLDDLSNVDDLIASCVDIFDIFQMRSIREMEEALNKHFGNVESADTSVAKAGTVKDYGATDEDATTKGKKNKSAKDVKDVANDIDAQFNLVTEGK